MQARKISQRAQKLENKKIKQTGRAKNNTILSTPQEQTDHAG